MEPAMRSLLALVVGMVGAAAISAPAPKFGPVGLVYPLPHTLKGHTDAVMSVTFSRDGKMIASGSYDETIILWGAKARKK
jgi:hypothetical protein